MDKGILYAISIGLIIHSLDSAGHVVRKRLVGSAHPTGLFDQLIVRLKNLYRARHSVA